MENKNKKRNSVRSVIAVIAVILIVFGIAWFAKSEYDRNRAGKEYTILADSMKNESELETFEEIKETPHIVITVPETEEESGEEASDKAPGETNEYTNEQTVEAVRENLVALREINPDIIGWLTIPGTSIDYPILQGDDNDYYLHRNWRREEISSGSIFLDYACESDLSGPHNVIYGHHMKDGSMFKELMRFREPDFFESHRDIYIYTMDRTIRLETFACTYVPSESIRRKTVFSSEDEFGQYIDAMVEGAEIYYEPEDEILHLYSFITCSYEFDDARTILYAYEI